MAQAMCSEDDTASWLRRVLSEERRDLDRLLRKRHEDLLLQLECLPLAHAKADAPQLRWSSVEEMPVEQPGPTPDDLVSHNRKTKRASFEPINSVQTVFPMSDDVSLEVTVGRVQSCLAEVSEEEEEPPSARQKIFQEFLQVKLDVISSFVICLYIGMIVLRVEYRGIELAHTIASEIAPSAGDHFHGSRSAEEVWPRAREVFEILDLLFGSLFCIELALRLVYKIRLWQDRYWNAFDALIIILFWAEQIFVGILTQFVAVEPTVLRMARMLRLMRLLKLVRYVRSFDALHLIVKAIMSTMSVLSWTVTLLFMLMAIVAAVNATLLDSFIRDPNQDIEVRKQAYMYWGSFIRAWISMFEITLANWGPHCWFLVDNVSPWWCCFFIVWKCCVGFAVVQVIISVFIQHTFKVASRDEDIMIQDKAKASEAYLKHLDSLFTVLDQDNSGAIIKRDFDAALGQERVKHWFGALEIDVSDVGKVFRMLDNGHGTISKDEFITGLRKLKGVAQSIDLIRLTKECERIRKHVEKDVATPAPNAMIDVSGCWSLQRPTV